MEEANDSSSKNTIKQLKSVESSDLDDENSKDSVLTTGSKLCLVGAASLDVEVEKAAKGFGLEVLTSEDGSEWQDLPVNTIYFVLEEFEGNVFDNLHKLGHRLLGTTALRELAARQEPLPHNNRPLYSLAMWGLIVAFTGFRKKEELKRLIQKIHNMGGSIRSEMNSKVTHLVAQRCGGSKYQYAMTFRVPIVAATWVHDAWAMRSQPEYSAADSSVITCHKLKPFQGARVCFLGFPEDEQKHMAEVLVQNGGTLTDHEDAMCSHMVVDESTVSKLPDQAPQHASIVKAEWFWASVQNEGCVDEKDYLFEDNTEVTWVCAQYLESLVSPSRRTTPLAPTSRARKRKRLQEAVARLASGAGVSPATNKRRSSVSDAGLLSVSGSFLDCTNSPATNLSDVGDAEPTKVETPLKNLSPRHQVFLELVQTEFNYVNTLKTIMTLYKEPLEQMCETPDQLLSPTEVKIIFGHLPPIYETHCRMLEQLRHAASHWTEDTSIGNIILNFSGDLVKAYPPYVNFYETTREMLLRCDQTMPRFHAFLKIGQTKPECGRQSLLDLLIRPVQRLPSINLLLNDILKHTNKSNPDHSALQAAAASIREVTTHINEDKRRTEGQMVMFDIFNDIENCPPHLVSSHRSFITRCDITELSDGLSGRGDALAFFLFSDIVEVCKKRSKAFNSLKSPNTAKLNGQDKTRPASFKHVRLMPLSHIKMVIDITETEDCHNKFALVVKSNQELREKRYSFRITDEGTDKMTFLRTLCRQMANTLCRPDAENFLASLNQEELDIDTSDIGVGTLKSKAAKFASRTRIKVGRAFSFNKTPNKLKRAMSTMMSPFGSTSNLTPASQLAQMRLASCNNLNELGSATPPPPAAPPLSVQPTRRNKHPSLSVASLRRL
ncbi:protein ECT2-like isoform X4 [Macrosteles quadrilineatus]|uniref:protein ECT2-like isoform X4 n=1 Tax=Macrosteles quadrilineatus TaxID=74068 RepID=UPI0023E1D7BB|nr:protein ECT2-like isoform X4 [Macrosteles quadrilineatus]